MTQKRQDQYNFSTKIAGIFIAVILTLLTVWCSYLFCEMLFYNQIITK